MDSTNTSNASNQTPHLPLPGADPAPLSNWQRIRLLIQVVEIRLRFIVILIGTGLAIGYWDTLQNYWDKWTRPKTAGMTQVQSDAEFYCPMHPWVARPNRDPDGSVPKCPICGMSMSTRKKGVKPELPANVTGRVQFSPDRIRLAGLSTQPVEYRTLLKKIVTVGSVRYDESRLSRIVSRVGGYVEKLLVNKTFERVELGQPMAEVYSPELVSTIRELLVARKSGQQWDLGGLARRKLELFGVASAEIEEILRAGDPGHRLLIRSPQHGYVIQKEIVRGARVEVGQTLFEVADLSQVWIEADVYEKDIAFLRSGQTIEATIEALPGMTFHGRVTLVHPMMDAETRTNAVRFSVENDGLWLRPGMYATVRISVPFSDASALGGAAPSPLSTSVASATGEHYACPMHPEVTSDKPGVSCPKCGMKLEAQVVTTGTAGQVLAVPELAVIDTGTKSIVYVERDAGVYEGTLVELGPRVDEFYPVLKGLKAGDRIVARGAFLVDAETRLNPAAGAAFSGASGGPKAAAKTESAPSNEVKSSGESR
ncbi:MAG: efflux RND transporter periplasmic adaptor subunit [Candidatus Wallbacteria bacterium]|nr:efflux RND transporter periplasmic adaptor subunit [Candidatus Wallbacteria bacterium]